MAAWQEQKTASGKGRIVAHCGGWEATRAEVEAVEMPAPTASYEPLPYRRIFEDLGTALGRSGVEIGAERYALARDGRQAFWTWDLLPSRDGDGFLPARLREKFGERLQLALGGRSSYDKSLAFDVAAGSHVFVCDNLAMMASGGRKHTANALRDLFHVCITFAEGLRGQFEAQLTDFDLLESVPLDGARPIRVELGAGGASRLVELPADDYIDRLIGSSIRTNLLSGSQAAKVLREWQAPSYPEHADRNALNLLHAFTHVAKDANAHRQQLIGAEVQGALRRSLKPELELIA